MADGFFKSKCATITTGSAFVWGAKKTFGGRKIKFEVCPIKGGVSIRRAGRRGGVRSASKTRGGMTVCVAQGQNSRCIKGPDFIAFPGGAAKTRKWNIPGVMLNGYSKTNRKARRTRIGAKRGR